MKDVGKPCEGEPHARIDGGRLETGCRPRSKRKLSRGNAGQERQDLVALAGGIKFPLTIWLMRGCGLRIEEALAVQRSCFRDGGAVLRVYEQASRDGKKTRPLKHRK